MRNLTIIRVKVVRQSSLLHCTLRVHDTSFPITFLCLQLHLQSLPLHFLTLRPATEFRTSKTRCTHTIIEHAWSVVPKAQNIERCERVVSELHAFSRMKCIKLLFLKQVLQLVIRKISSTLIYCSFDEGSTYVMARTRAWRHQIRF